MKKESVCFLFILLLVNLKVLSQNNTASSGFKEYYPIHVKPSLGYLSSMNDYETILFEAKPVVYYSFWNNMRSRMQDTTYKENTSTYKPGNTIYALFQPQIRMYDETSLPVKTPSYRAALGWQFLKKRTNDDFYSIALETGHYSNGQSGCIFASGLIDETPECEAAHALITPETNLSELLNRKNGNFSTNWTKLAFNYRFNIFKDNGKPRMAHSLLASWEYYHNDMLGLIDIGGFSDFNLGIYGRNRFNLSYEFIHTYSGKVRYSVEFKTEYISNPHPFVAPLRGEITGILYPGNLDFGIYLTYVNGHDNYNYRFVDSGNQFGIGIIWDWFAPLDRSTAKIMDSRRLKQTQNPLIPISK